MNSQLFRKKSVDRVSSPEQLNEYIRVANPGVWMVLAAIVILLAGVVVWGCIGHLDTHFLPLSFVRTARLANSAIIIITIGTALRNSI